MNGVLPAGAMRRLFREAALVGTPEASTRIGQYRLIRQIGAGSMGTVHEAEDPRLGRRVAVKILREVPGSLEVIRERFRREAEASARLAHPNVVRVYEIGHDEGRDFLVMELVDGRPLDQVLARGAREHRPLVELLEKAARGVAAAHEAGIIHRDLKPANIIVAADGTPKVADFGLALRVDEASTLTRTGIPIGTPLYMSPEQVAGDSARVRAASDVYSLGALLYEILAGRPPHQGSSTADIYVKIVRDDAASPRTLNPRIASDLDTICLKAISRNPDHRYRDAGAFADDLRRFLDGLAIEARPLGFGGRLWRKGLRHRASLLPLAAAVLLLAVGGIALFASSARRERERNEALALVEAARPTLEKAVRSFYRPEEGAAQVIKRATECRNQLEDALRKAPELPVAHYYLGIAQDLAGAEDEAGASFRRAIAGSPGFGAAHFQLARLQLIRAFARNAVSAGLDEAGASASTEEATRELDLAMRAGSGFDDALQVEVARAMIAYVHADVARALATCRAAIERFGTAEGAENFHLLLGVMTAGEEQRRAYDKAIAIRPKYPWALFYRSLAYLKVGESAKALRDLDQALELRPDFDLARENRGSAKQMCGDIDGAIADFTEVIRRAPKLQDAWFNRGNAHATRKAWAPAEADYTTAVQLKPDHGASWINRGEARFWQGNLEGAVADFSEAIRCDPGCANGYQSRGAVLGRLRRYDESERDVRKALELAPAGWKHRPAVQQQLDDLLRAKSDF